MGLFNFLDFTEAVSTDVQAQMNQVISSVTNTCGNPVIDSTLDGVNIDIGSGDWLTGDTFTVAATASSNFNCSINNYQETAVQAILALNSQTSNDDPNSLTAVSNHFSKSSNYQDMTNYISTQTNNSCGNPVTMSSIDNVTLVINSDDIIDDTSFAINGDSTGTYACNIMSNSNLTLAASGNLASTTGGGSGGTILQDILIIVLVIIVVAGVVFSIKYYMGHKSIPTLPATTGSISSSINSSSISSSPLMGPRPSFLRKHVVEITAGIVVLIALIVIIVMAVKEG